MAPRDLTVVPQHVVRRFGKSGAGREIAQGRVRTVEVIVMEEVREEGSALTA
jgi:hypothetical protein